jgi:hypothetical protein
VLGAHTSDSLAIFAAGNPVNWWNRNYRLMIEPTMSDRHGRLVVRQEAARAEKLTISWPKSCRLDCLRLSAS